ncbi:MAG: hypothetical protein MI919_18860, partial [Holophagales bacterium]|nr:hypothetical protein [Holophagales bacterium]
MSNSKLPSPATDSMLSRVAAIAGLLCLTAAAGPVLAEASGMTQFGYDRTRNMVSDAEGLPTEWDLRSGKNVKWR